MKISIDSKQIKQATIGLNFVQKNIPKAFGSALNRVGQQVKTAASKEIRKTYDIKASDVKKYGNIKVTKTESSTLQLLLTSKGPNIPLIRFKTRPSKPPKRRPNVLNASVKRSGGKAIPGAFVAGMKSGHIGVFKRVSKKRNPIKELYGPAVPIMLGDDGVAESLNRVASEGMNKRLDHEINRVLGRFK
ncbi:phage tail protein [Paenibacillus sp. GCM10027626]|uniref:phage tail protein n=1 Tax=Paenibacillus sp. GCM10027626 TaxID=3273411 RepID=UPI003639CDBB